MALDLQHFKEKLIEEKKSLETTLKTVGRVNPQNADDWEVTPVAEPEMEFNDEAADKFEELEEREATEVELEERLREINHALKKMDQETFGLCEIGGEEIELERLEINPAARTCKKHLNAR